MTRDAAHHKRVSSWLGVSKRVSGVTGVDDENTLEKYLSRASCDLCILLIGSDEQILPKCTISYPDMCILVVTTYKNMTNPEWFYQQGATDVVSLFEPAIAQHTISRLIDDCLRQQKMQYLQTRHDELQLEVELLRSQQRLSAHRHPKDASNDHFHSTKQSNATNLRTIPEPKIENIVTKSNLRDSATGIPSRKNVLQRFQSMLGSEVKAPRFTAVLVSIMADKNTQRKSVDAPGAQKNVQDMTLYRAADALQKCISQTTIFGRINQNALLLIQPSDIEPVSRNAANRVRESLGTLGGLIDVQSDVHINTMNLPSTTKISADEVLQRLETLT